MNALQRVLAEPHDAGGIAKLRNVVRGAPVRSVNTSAQSGAAAAPSAAEEPRSFLDNIGSYDRERNAKKGSHRLS